MYDDTPIYDAIAAAVAKARDDLRESLVDGICEHFAAAMTNERLWAWMGSGK